jgi:hypothetical protein
VLVSFLSTDKDVNLIQYYPVGRWESQESSVNIDMGWMVPQHPDRLWGLPNLLFNGIPRCLFPGGKAAGA